MKSGVVWIVEYWSKFHKEWIQTSFHYATKDVAGLAKKDEKEAYPNTKFRVRRYIRAEPKAKKVGLRHVRASHTRLLLEKVLRQGLGIQHTVKNHNILVK